MSQPLLVWQILKKIKGSVVSQRGRKDLQSGARRGFGDANPPRGVQLCTSASGLLGFFVFLNHGLFFN